MKTDLRQTQTLGQRPHGFTLIELLVVISIIAVIASIGVVVGGSMQRAAAESQTRALLNQLAGSATEYREQVGQDVMFAISATTYAATPEDDCESINRYVSTVRSNSRPALEQLRTVDGELFEGGVFDETAPASNASNPVANTTIRDRFDLPIRYFPGSDNLSASANQTAEGLPRRKRPYFAAAGIDGMWGTIDPATNQPNDDGAGDNIYSFQLQ